MNWLKSALPAAVGALLGCVAGLTYAAKGPTATPERERPARAARLPVSAEQDDQELETLSNRVRSLEQRVSLLTAALNSARGTAAPAAAGDQEEVPAPADVADPVFEAAVRDILDRIDDERREEQVNRTRQRTQFGAQRTAERLTQELGLTQSQQQELFEIVKKHYEALAALRDEDAPDRPATPGEWRDKLREIRDATDERMKAALSPRQLEKYESLDSSEFFGGRPRRPQRTGD
ncbi:MAG: hypothetical protein GX607_07725 [Myxococcales bacterium]|jgi:hypothetical protein|nr:hypothetical protein [Myxococcales bacterium]